MTQRKRSGPPRAKPGSQAHGNSLARPALASIAALLVFAGQLAFFVYPSVRVWGLLFTLSGLALFMWARVGPPFRWGTRLVAGIPLTRRRLLIFVALMLSVTATWFAAAMVEGGRTDFAPALALWAAAGVALVAGFSTNGLGLSELRGWADQNRREALAVLGVTLLGVVLRFYKLGEIPWVVEGDGGRIGTYALGSSSGLLANPYFTWESMGGLYLQWIGLAIRALGRNALALRLLPAIGGSLAVPALYLLGRRLFGPRVALSAAILLAASHSHLHFSRTVAVSYTQGTFLVPLMLYSLLSGLENKSSSRMAVAAVILAIHFSIYIDSVIFIALALSFLGIAGLVARPLMQGRRPQVIAFLVAAAIMLLPQTYFAITDHDQYMDRFNADGIVQTGWLANTMDETGLSAPEILAGRVAHAFLSLFYFPAVDFYGSTKSMLHFLTAALFLMGLVYSLWRTRQPHFLMVNGYLFAPAVAIGLTAIPESADSYRMLMAVPAAMLLAGVGLAELVGVLANSGPASGRTRTMLSGAILVTICTLSLKSYFVDFTARCRYGGDPQTRYASYLGRYLSTVERSSDVVLLSDEVFQHGTHGSVDFLSDNMPVRNFHEPAASLVPAPGTVVVAVPTRIDELRAWVQEHPDGELTLTYDCQVPILMAYELP